MAVRGKRLSGLRLTGTRAKRSKEDLGEALIRKAVEKKEVQGELDVADTPVATW